MWKSFSFPLAWTVLPHGGSTSTAHRIALRESVMATLQGKRLALLAEREFIGRDWLRALKRLGINATIRLHATTRVNGVEVWACFTKRQPGELHRWHGKLTVYGVQMRDLACKNLHGEILYLAYHGRSSQAIDRYAWR